MKDSFSWDRHFATMFFAVWWKTKHVKLLFYSHLQVGGDKNLMCLFLSTFTCAQLSSSLFLIDASGFFSFCIRVSQLLTLGWRSSCLRRPVFSCEFLSVAFLPFLSLFKLSSSYLTVGCNTHHKKGSFMRAELRPFKTLFSQWLIWVPLHFWVSPIEKTFLLLSQLIILATSYQLCTVD